MKQKLTIKQVAQLWGCSTRTVYRRINNGTLPHQPGPTLGSGPLINKHDALKALKNPKTAPRPYIRKTKENNQ